MNAGYRRDVQQYARNAERSIRGVNNKIAKIEEMLDECEDRIDNWNDYGKALLKSLFMTVDYMHFENKLNAQTAERWKALCRRYHEAE